MNRLRRAGECIFDQADALTIIAVIVLPLGWMLPLCRLAWAQAQARRWVRRR